MKLTSLLAVLGLVLLTSGCGSDFYSYSLKIGSSEVVLPQKDESFITGDYEFKSVLFISSAKKFAVSIRHPVLPVSNQESAIAQVEFDFVDSGNRTFRLNSIEFAHPNLNGEEIVPKESYKIGENFYVLKYDSSQFSSKVREIVEIEFNYNGK
ncbi:MAG: hypothetical protein V7727_20995 [Sneathiella sp.]